MALSRHQCINKYRTSLSLSFPPSKIFTITYLKDILSHHPSGRSRNTTAMSSHHHPPHPSPTPIEQLPTATQVHNVASLSSIHAPHLPVRHILQPALDDFSEQWKTDFLFTTDPIHVRHFEANISTTALLHNLQFTRAASATLQPSPLPLNALNEHVNGYFLSIPAFTVDSTTAGFGVFNVKTNSNISWLVETENYGLLYFLNYRFLVDAKRATMLLIYDAPDDDVVMLDIGRYDSNTSYRMQRALMRRTHLQHILTRHVNHGHPLDASELASALISFDDEFYPHPCPLCATPPSGICSCSLETPCARHPFDNSHAVQALLRHTGVFEGVSSVTSDHANYPATYVNLGSRVQITPMPNVSIVTQLKNWTLGDYAKRTPHNPWQSAIFTATTRQDHHEFAAASAAGAHGTREDTSQILRTFSNNLKSESLSVSCAQNLHTLNNFKSETRSVSCAPSSMAAAIIDTPVETRSAPIRSNAPCTQCGSSALETPAHRSSLPIPVFCPGNSAPIFNIQAVHVNVQADAGNESSYRTQARQSLNDEMKRIKDNARKERNRESARRSNAKKKMIRDDLESDLRLLNDRLTALREREIKLRHENLRLRKLLEGKPT